MCFFFVSNIFVYMDQVTVLQDWLHRDFNLPNIHTIKYKEAVYILSSADGACKLSSAVWA